MRDEREALGFLGCFLSAVLLVGYVAYLLAGSPGSAVVGALVIFFLLVAVMNG